jgi:hypothetical protein
MFEKTWDEQEVIKRWPKAKSLLEKYASHPKLKWETYAIKKTNAFRLTELTKTLDQPSSPQSDDEWSWFLRLYTVKPGGKRLIFKEEITIPPIEEDIESIYKPKDSLCAKSTDELIAELRSMGGFSAFVVKREQKR